MGGKYGKVVERVIACALQVGETMGAAHSLDQYGDALDRAMRGEKLQFARKYPIGIPFDGPPDRGFRADFIVEGGVLLELAYCEALGTRETDQARRHLRESGADICLLINFGRVPAEVHQIPRPSERSLEQD